MTTTSYTQPAGEPWPEAADFPPPEVPQPAPAPVLAPLFPEQPLPPAGPTGPASWSGRLRTLPTRAWRGRADDPRWVRPALLGLMAATAVLYLWDLSASGWANAFYSAAVQAGSQSWKAFFFGSSDASNFITVDKPPASLWPMALSARIFGLSSWSLLAPQALMGAATVGVLYAAVRRRFSPLGGLLAGAAFALTPVAALMFRFNNPDALLVLLLTVSAYGLIRAIETASTRWLLFTGAVFGFAFLTKTLAAFLILPAFAVVYLVVAPTGLWRRVRQTLLAGVAVVVAGGWWVAVVELLPASARPYVGGSQDNSFLSLTFGYNGLGRVDGNERGSVGGGGRLPAGLDLPAGAAQGMRNRGWGQTGITRLFGSDIGGQIAWLLPAALILLVVALWATRRHARTDTARAAFLVWGGWLISTALIFSFMSGIFHQYYTVALAPAVAALVGMGVDGLWRARHRLPYALALAGTLATTAVWAFVLLGRSPGFLPWLRWAVLAAGLVAAAALVAGQFAGRTSGRTGARIASVAGLVGLAAALGGPAAYAVDTVGTAHNGSIITAGPSVKGAFGPGSFGKGGRGGKGATGRGFGGQVPGGQGGQGFPGGQGGQGGQGGFPGGRAPHGQNGGGFPGGFGGGQGGFPGAVTGDGSGTGGRHERGNGTGDGTTGTPGNGNGAAGMPGAGGPEGAGGAGGMMGGLLGGTKVSDEAAALLEQDADHYTWAAATTGSQNAASYQLATGKPVMALGGFNGTDPSLSLAGFQKYVQEGKIHWYVAGGSHRGFGGGDDNGQQNESAQIEAWVTAHFTAKTVGGATFYDLTVTPSS
ncbi:glycosyltransferase family 39 protein [Streptomyces sp. SP17BM10]|uniref:glycosyltransferase family 39 protein n=1 Tax=Streptomyces sp. SP17BM10 TaxID=3002530 RepID=UPI002E7A82E6|nr:glycosyltransferase family 39 protein [Streptomyces sp. SP17BM10]MEE1784961.1 glycosyltransferase family 39 protein [Streptomyces sp. SP17BM10]